jgi:hypothetical protein
MRLVTSGRAVAPATDRGFKSHQPDKRILNRINLGKFESYGRGAGVGRGRGVGVHLPVHGVGVGVGVVVVVDVAVAVAVGVGEAIGVDVGVKVGVRVGVEVGLGATVGVYSITQRLSEKTWSGDNWSGMHAFFRFQVTQPVP